MKQATSLHVNGLNYRRQDFNWRQMGNFDYILLEYEWESDRTTKGMLGCRKIPSVKYK